MAGATRVTPSAHLSDHVYVMRNEAEVFADLKVVCQSAGYVHALANLSFRDNVLSYSGQMSPSDMLPIFSPDRLIRTEISTLIGLMIQRDIDWAMPAPQIVKELMDRTESLLKELHGTFLSSLPDALNVAPVSVGARPWPYEPRGAFAIGLSAILLLTPRLRRLTLQEAARQRLPEALLRSIDGKRTLRAKPSRPRASIRQRTIPVSPLT